MITSQLSPSFDSTLEHLDGLIVPFNITAESQFAQTPLAILISSLHNLSKPPLEPLQTLRHRVLHAFLLLWIIRVAPDGKPMPSRLIDLVLHLRHLPPSLLRIRMNLLHLALLLELDPLILQSPPNTDRHNQALHIARKRQVTRMQRHRGIYKWHLLPIHLNHVALQPGADGVPPPPAESHHANLLTLGGRAPQRLQEVYADLVGGRLLVPRHPHHERGRTGQHACVLGEGGLLGGIDGDQHVGDLQWYGITLEEVRQVDEVFAAFGVGVGDEFVVGQGEAEDV